MHKYIKSAFVALILCLNLEAKDFIVDCNKCVIGVGFTSDEVENFKKEKGKDDFYVLADDANCYGFVFREYLEANGIEYKHASRLESPHIKLVFPNASIDIKKLNWLYEYYLYQKGKKPHKLEDIATPSDEVNAYFNIANPKYPER